MTKLPKKQESMLNELLEDFAGDAFAVDLNAWVLQSF